MLVMRLINAELTTLNAYTSQDLHNKLEELDIIHWSCQLIMPEMTWAIVIIKATTTT
jgi:hypothetical protein